MDTLSHACWGYFSLRWRGQREARWGALAGAAPDILFFAPYAAGRIARDGWPAFEEGSRFSPAIWRDGGPPVPPPLLEAYNHYYVYTHSLVILAAVAWLAYLIFKKRWWLWLAAPYALHVLMDIPTHERYRTPFLFPLSMWTVDGISWGRPIIFWPNWIAIIALGVWLFGIRKAKP